MAVDRRVRGGGVPVLSTLGLGSPFARTRTICGILKTANPVRSNDVDFFPGIPCKWGLGYMINTLPGPNGRSVDSVTCAGIFKTYYWLDSKKRVAGVILTQILPFADRPAVALYGRFERAVYGALAPDVIGRDADASHATATLRMTPFRSSFLPI